MSGTPPPETPASVVYPIREPDVAKLHDREATALEQNASAHARIAGLLAAAAPTVPKQDHEVWLEAFLVRSHGTRLAATNAVYADDAVKLYRARGH
jgi:hypothetical protein